MVGEKKRKITVAQGKNTIFYLKAHFTFFEETVLLESWVKSKSLYHSKKAVNNLLHLALYLPIPVSQFNIMNNRIQNVLAFRAITFKNLDVLLLKCHMGCVCV